MFGSLLLGVFLKIILFKLQQTTHPKLTLWVCASFQASKSEGCTTALCAGGFDRDTWWNWVIGRNGISEEVILQISGHRFWRKESKKKQHRTVFWWIWNYDLFVYMYVCVYIYICVCMCILFFFPCQLCQLPDDSISGFRCDKFDGLMVKFPFTPHHLSAAQVILV